MLRKLGWMLLAGTLGLGAFAGTARADERGFRRGYDRDNRFGRRGYYDRDGWRRERWERERRDQWRRRHVYPYYYDYNYPYGW